MISAAIIGASGYTGGELLRLLLAHPSADIVAATSRSLAGKPVHRTHPNLRGHTDLVFTSPDDAPSCDVLFLCTPHGESARTIDTWLERAPLVIDLSADFRLNDHDTYQRWFREQHPRPDLFAEAVYGLPECTRDRLPNARLISGVGCNATAIILALLPLARAGLIQRAVADVKVGSSEAGATPNAGSHHPVRARALRTYSPAGHRHLAEVEQALRLNTIDATITTTDTVRGVLCTAHVMPTEPLDTRALRRLYRDAYDNEPFVRVVADNAGMHRLPDPRTLLGSNHADVGFALDETSGRVIALAAIDNLVKGAAGSAVQAMNLARNLPETAGLTFPGLHPA